MDSSLTNVMSAYTSTNDVNDDVHESVRTVAAKGDRTHQLPAREHTDLVLYTDF